jgi:hypothetical protein
LSAAEIIASRSSAWYIASRSACAPRQYQLIGLRPIAEFFALLERACRVDSLIPDVDAVDFDDPAVRAELRVALREFDAAAGIKTFESTELRYLAGPR